VHWADGNLAVALHACADLVVLKRLHVAASFVHALMSLLPQVQKGVPIVLCPRTTRENTEHVQYSCNWCPRRLAIEG
jgi:hypothetical protein